MAKLCYCFLSMFHSKKIILISLCLLTLQAGVSQTLLTIGKQNISKQSFLASYEKNKTTTLDTLSMEAYLSLYIRYQLKLAAAREQRFDTLQHIKDEIASFREQLAERYLYSETEIQALIKEAFQRSKEELELSHLFFPFGADSLKAKQKANEAWQQLKNGRPFQELMRADASEATLKQAGSYLGYITVFSVPYEIETAAYNLMPGNYSNPIKGTQGYHILHCISRRSAMGTFQGAHILISFPPQATRDVIEQRKQLADSIYQLLKSGADFAQLAIQFSDDRNTASTGGNLPDFNIASFDQQFTSAAFALKENGDFSAPVYTDHGYHIILRKNRIPVAEDLNNNETIFYFRTMVEKDDRFEIAKEAIRKEMYVQLGVRSYIKHEKRLWDLTDSLLRKDIQGAKNIALQKEVLFQVDKRNYVFADWLQYVQYQKTSAADEKNRFSEWMKKWQDSIVTQAYKAKLEDYAPAFAAQMNEFREAGLIFEIMDREVWRKAASDTTALLKHYDVSRNKFIWQPGFSGILVNCIDQKTADALAERIAKTPKAWQQILQDYAEKAIADSGRFELSQLPLKDGKMPVPYTLLSLGSNEQDGSVSFIYVLKTHDAPELRRFEEAIGAVINDYQQVLEEKWVENLKQKFPVKRNEALWKTMLLNQ